MKKFKAAFVNNNGEASINYVYTEQQKNKIISMNDMTSQIYSLDDIQAGKLADV